MLTPKQEKFCAVYIETSNQAEAYRAAYNTENMNTNSVHRKAHELIRNVKVSARINELQQEHAERHKMTVDELLAELEEARTLAKDIEQPSPMVTATMGKAKLLGLDRPVADEDEQGAKLDITFNVAPAQGDIKVTKGDG